MMPRMEVPSLTEMMPPFDMAAALPKFDLSAIMPRMDVPSLTAMMPPFDMTAALPKLDLSAIMPRMDVPSLTAMMPRFDMTAALPKLDLSATMPRMEVSSLTAMMPPFDMTAALPKFDLSAIMPRMDVPSLTAMMPPFDMTAALPKFDLSAMMPRMEVPSLTAMMPPFDMTSALSTLNLSAMTLHVELPGQLRASGTLSADPGVVALRSLQHEAYPLLASLRDHGFEVLEQHVLGAIEVGVGAGVDRWCQCAASIRLAITGVLQTLAPQTHPRVISWVQQNCPHEITDRGLPTPRGRIQYALRYRLGHYEHQWVEDLGELLGDANTILHSIGYRGGSLAPVVAKLIELMLWFVQEAAGVDS